MNHLYAFLDEVEGKPNGYTQSNINKEYRRQGYKKLTKLELINKVTNNIRK